MKLELSSASPWNSNYCTPEGQVIYKVESPWSLTGPRPIKISRVLPSEVDHASHDNTSVVDRSLTMKDEFEFVGEVEYHTIKESVIRYGGKDAPVGKWFKKGEMSEMGPYGRPRIFNGPDGKEYAWKMTSSTCKLFRHDESDAPVAIYHSKKYGIIGKGQAAYLEIFPGGERMLDLIVVTFLYMEKLRQDSTGG